MIYINRTHCQLNTLLSLWANEYVWVCVCVFVCVFVCAVAANNASPFLFLFIYNINKHKRVQLGHRPSIRNDGWLLNLCVDMRLYAGMLACMRINANVNVMAIKMAQLAQWCDLRDYSSEVNYLMCSTVSSRYFGQLTAQSTRRFNRRFPYKHHKPITTNICQAHVCNKTWV